MWLKPLKNRFIFAKTFRQYTTESRHQEWLVLVEKNLRAHGFIDNDHYEHDLHNYNNFKKISYNYIKKNMNENSGFVDYYGDKLTFRELIHDFNRYVLVHQKA